ncbi:hypothetical protein ACFQU7_35205 [Pseudoroseomonas wenyumeiae]
MSVTAELTSGPEADILVISPSYVSPSPRRRLSGVGGPPGRSSS